MTERLGGAVSARLAAVVFERTEGHALFLVNIVEHLVGQGLVVRREGQWTLQDGAEAKVIGLPEGLRQLLIRRLEDLPFEGQRVLEAASVVGERFPWRRRAGPSPRWRTSKRRVKRWRRSSTSTTSACGSGRMGPAVGATGLHALYRQVLYDRLGTARRRQLHRRIGLRLEVGYGAGKGDWGPARRPLRARGRDPRAVDYWQQAGDAAARRNAHHEAIAALRKARQADPAGEPRALAARAHAPARPGGAAEGHEGVGSPDVGEVYTGPIPSASRWGRHRSSLWYSGGSRSFM